MWRLHHPVGTFCFAELQTPAPEVSAGFYCDLLGWSIRQISDRYWMFRSGGSDVVGLRRADTHRWLACVRVDSVENTIARAQTLEMSVVTPAVETPGVAPQPRSVILKGPTLGCGNRAASKEPLSRQDLAVSGGPSWRRRPWVPRNNATPHSSTGASPTR